MCFFSVRLKGTVSLLIPRKFLHIWKGRSFAPDVGWKTRTDLQEPDHAPCIRMCLGKCAVSLQPCWYTGITARLPSLVDHDLQGVRAYIG